MAHVTTSNVSCKQRTFHPDIPKPFTRDQDTGRLCIRIYLLRKSSFLDDASSSLTSRTRQEPNFNLSGGPNLRFYTDLPVTLRHKTTRSAGPAPARGASQGGRRAALYQQIENSVYLNDTETADSTPTVGMLQIWSNVIKCVQSRVQCGRL